MKITLKERLDEELLGTREIGSYTQEMSDDTASFYGREKSINVRFYIYGVMENETQNEDGTYTYDYTSFQSGYIPVNIEREPEINDTIKELIYNYGIKNFIIDGQEVDAGNYYAAITLKATYVKKTGEAKINEISYKIVDDDYNFPKQSEDNLVNVSEIDANSLKDLNEKLETSFSGYEDILYLKNGTLSKEYRIKLALSQIEKDISLQSYIFHACKLKKPRFNSFEEAIESGAIDDNHMEEYITRRKDRKRWIDGDGLPSGLLEKVFERKPELCDAFSEDSLPAELVRKYSPNFNVMKINPNELQHSDLTAVLQGISDTFGNRYRARDYLKYFEGFYNEPENLKRILVVMNKSSVELSSHDIVEFLSKIPEESLKQDEIRDTLVYSTETSLNKIIKYGFNYDKESSEELLKKLEKSMEVLDDSSIIKILQDNGISNDKILESLRKNNFKVFSSYKDWAKELRELGITGINIDDVRDTLSKFKDFSILDDIEPINEKAAEDILYGESDNNEEKDKNTQRKVKIFEILHKYFNITSLFSKLDSETKNTTKKIIIDNLDLDENVQQGLNANKLKTLASSLNMNMEDFVSVYIKLMNCGYTKTSLMWIFNEILPEDKKEEFNNRIEKSNIHPSPKHFWLTDSGLERIYIGDLKLDRRAIKEKIQKDGTCFSTKVTTDLTGTSKDGKPIPINNLSKWLFGVPGVKGHLTVTKNGNYIQLPSNTPEETTNLIKDVLMERNKNQEEMVN